MTKANEDVEVMQSPFNLVFNVSVNKTRYLPVKSVGVQVLRLLDRSTNLIGGCFHLSDASNQLNNVNWCKQRNAAWNVDATTLLDETSICAFRLFTKLQ